MSSSTNQDSPLSITASIAGILTFVAAILAALYARFTYLRTADSEYFRVKASLNWYKTESAFMQDLISAANWDDGMDGVLVGDGGSLKGREKGKEKEMYGFVLEQLGKLEERLLECIAEAEEGVSNVEGKEKRWTLIPQAVRGRTDIAMSWLPVRAKALDLVRQRDALGNRVLFAQMSLVSSRVKEEHSKNRKREERQRERMERLEKLASAQHEKLDKLEDLVYRLMHRNRVRVDTSDSGFQDSSIHETDASTTTREDDSDTESSDEKISISTQSYSIPST
ncbi:uncharacterized protein PAC_18207 [Phialocephala subalpina]|uniref:Uncharacterized protein n=1 Tax=Phialocephala subalpina TaxID=576137 RepID=A0A1L7XTJ9_9HELO|nr:uncharacterized protein PAC_18207 [Phialocephala subalpina]